MELTLPEYITFARKIAYRFSRHNDEDCVADVARHLMLAYRKFNGSGNIKAYMAKQGQYAVQRYLYNLKTSIPIPDHTKNNVNVVNSTINKEIIDRLSEWTTDKQHACITKYFLDGMTMQEIGEELGCSKQNVESHIKSGLKNIRKQLC